MRLPLIPRRHEEVFFLIRPLVLTIEIPAPVFRILKFKFQKLLCQIVSHIFGLLFQCLVF